MQEFFSIIAVYSTPVFNDPQARNTIREEQATAVYFHCTSYRLNLVFNDLNKVKKIRNTVETIEEMKF